MKLIRTDYRALAHAGQEGLPLRLNGGVVAIGNFDGVHRGHQALLRQQAEIAQSNGKPFMVMTFTPHPRRHFKPDQPPFQLSDSILQRSFIEKLGVDGMVELHFEGILARTSAPDFVRYILADAMQISHVVVGEDFRFGAGRQGDVDMLQEMGKQFGFGVTPVTLHADFLGGQPISSERIRAEIKLGHMATAQELLGRPWQTRAEVIHGDKRGREWGFPTANMLLHEFVHPAFGVYAARVRIEPDQTWHKAVMSFGKRPNFQVTQPLLEVHILDYEGDLYGRVLRVEWHDFLRPEIRFASVDLLKEAIADDVKRARELLA
jgi:riboflavin kinase/FMN adenylyltransferase